MRQFFSNKDSKLLIEQNVTPRMGSKLVTKHKTNSLSSSYGGLNKSNNSEFIPREKIDKESGREVRTEYFDISGFLNTKLSSFSFPANLNILNLNSIDFISKSILKLFYAIFSIFLLFVCNICSQNFLKVGL